MKYEIKHKRLYAFYNSKVLNALMIVVITGLLFMDYSGKMLLPIMCSSIALLFFICYSVWLWIRKPQQITINNLLSDMTSYLTLYFLIITTLKLNNQWWYIVPIVSSVIILFISLVKSDDKIYKISE